MEPSSVLVTPWLEYNPEMALEASRVARNLGTDDVPSKVECLSLDNARKLGLVVGIPSQSRPSADGFEEAPTRRYRYSVCVDMTTFCGRGLSQFIEGLMSHPATSGNECSDSPDVVFVISDAIRLPLVLP